MRFSIDRLQENCAICEDDFGNSLEIDLDLLPKGVKQTDVIKKTTGGAYLIDIEETQKRKSEACDILKSLTNH